MKVFRYLFVFFATSTMFVTPIHAQSQAYVADTSDCVNYVFQGNGSERSPFQIRSVPEFKCFVYHSKTFSTRGQFWLLSSNLDFSNEIGRELMIPIFEGDFNGRYNHIKGLNIDCKTDRTLCQSNIGLFQNTKNATIRNLFMDNARLTVGLSPTYERIAVGPLLGWGVNTKIFRISVTSSVEVDGGENFDGTSAVSGAIGGIYGGAIGESKAESVFSGNVLPYTNGVLVASACNIEIKSSYAMGNLRNALFVGGIAGTCNQGREIYKIENSFFIGNLISEINPNGANQHVTPLGSGQGTINNNFYVNSFWSGTTNFHTFLPVTFLPTLDQNWLQQNFLAATSGAWKSRVGNWPELLWILKINSESDPR